MTVNWSPDLVQDSTPLFKSIADAIERDIVNGSLLPGTRMPTHRALAKEIRVTVATVTRAYAEAKARGLLVGEVGRGTYVRAVPAQAAAAGEMLSHMADFRLNQPPTAAVEEILARDLAPLGKRVRDMRLLSYQLAPGRPQHRAAAARWLALAGVNIDPGRLVITNGAQQALMATFTVLTQPGDTILTEGLTYPGIRSLADLFRVNITGLEIDDEGVLPESLEAACRAGPVAAVYLTPNIHNPTATTLPLERRVEIARIAERYNVPIVEDDIYGPLTGGSPPPLFTLTEGDCYYICGTSKTVAPGLRIGYLAAPGRMVQYLANAVHATTWSAPPLNAEIVTSWIESGVAEQILEEHRAESQRRLGMARRILSGFDAIIPQLGYHVWLRLPEEWRNADFVQAAHANGVAVSPSTPFAVDPSSAPAAIRLSLGLPETPELVEEGLTRLRETLLSHDMPKNLII